MCFKISTFQRQEIYIKGLSWGDFWYITNSSRKLSIGRLDRNPSSAGQLGYTIQFHNHHWSNRRWIYNHDPYLDIRRDQILGFYPKEIFSRPFLGMDSIFAMLVALEGNSYDPEHYM